MTLGQGNLLHNRYRILDILGRGGMGAVYRAVDESLGVEVAVKENLFITEDYARQFRMEAIILAGIRHPNLPRVTDHFVIDDLGQYLVMDYIDGYDLRQQLEKNGPISEEEAIRIGVAACEALAYLHSRKPPILHRDIKLGNIKIGNDSQVFLVDFGLAKMGGEDEETMTGARAMTPGYSPPEQYGSARTDARSDIYSLGATLYAALTGVIPEDSLIRAVDGVKLTPLREHRPQVSERLASVIEKAMETNSVHRYQTAEDFKRALLGRTDPPTEVHSNENFQQAANQKPANQHERPANSPLLAITLLLLILLVAGGTVWYASLNPGSLQRGLMPLLSLIRTETAPVSVAPTSQTTPVSQPSPTKSTSPSIIPTKTSTAAIIPTRTTITPTRTKLPTNIPTITPSPTTTPTPAPTAQGGGTAEIAFASKIDSVSQIFMAYMDGSSPQQITNIHGGACSMDWSPDGQQLIFTSPCNGESAQYPDAGLYILNMQSGKTQPLPFTPGGDFEPAWSPDGEKIAFTSMRDGVMQIYLFNLSDSSLTNLSNSGIQARHPAWSPDSSQIVFTTLRLGQLQIWSMLADGTQKDQLLRTGGNFSEYLPAWAPDGASLFFSRTNNSLSSPSALINYVFKTGIYNQLTIPRPVVDVDISPDGHWIAYESTNGENPDIYICELPNGVPQSISISPLNDFDPAWRPRQ